MANPNPVHTLTTKRWCMERLCTILEGLNVTCYDHMSLDVDGTLYLEDIVKAAEFINEYQDVFDRRE